MKNLIKALGGSKNIIGFVRCPLRDYLIVKVNFVDLVKFKSLEALNITVKVSKVDKIHGIILKSPNIGLKFNSPLMNFQEVKKAIGLNNFVRVKGSEDGFLAIEVRSLEAIDLDKFEYLEIPHTWDKINGKPIFYLDQEKIKDFNFVL